MNLLYEKAKDLVFIRRTSDNKEFEEYPLIVQPQSILMTDPANNLVLTPLGNIVSDTASYALYAGSASYAVSTSYSPYSDTASFAISSSYSIVNFVSQSSASWASSSLSASYAKTSSYAATAATATLATNIFAITNGANTNFPVPFTNGAGSAIFYISSDGAITYNPSTDTLTVPTMVGTSSWSKNSLTSSFVTSSNIVGTITAFSSSWASASISASYSKTASYSINASNAVTASYVLSASYALSSSNAVTASYTLTSSVATALNKLGYDFYHVSQSNPVSAAFPTINRTVIASLPSDGVYECKFSAIGSSSAFDVGGNSVRFRMYAQDHIGSAWFASPQNEYSGVDVATTAIYPNQTQGGVTGIALGLYNDPSATWVLRAQQSMVIQAKGGTPISYSITVDNGNNLTGDMEWNLYFVVQKLAP